jgi:hypothetical protein
VYSAIGEQREAVLREGRPKPIPAKPLETFAVVLFDDACRMEREPSRDGAQGVLWWSRRWTSERQSGLRSDGRPEGRGEGVLQGRLFVVRVEALLVVLGEVAVGDLDEPACNPVGEPRDLVVRGRRQGREPELAVCVWHEESIRRGAVKVHVRVQGSAKFLDECNGPCLAIVDAGLASAVSLPREDAVQVSSEHLGWVLV